MPTFDEKDYDSSWDLEESDRGNLPQNEELFERKYAEWEQRDWFTWLKDNLTFPFQVERVEDEDDAYFSDIADRELFRLGHVMKVLAIDNEIDLYGIIVKVRENHRTAYVPLCDCELTPKIDNNFWPVREYVVWFANK